MYFASAGLGLFFFFFFFFLLFSSCAASNKTRDRTRSDSEEKCEKKRNNYKHAVGPTDRDLPPGHRVHIVHAIETNRFGHANRSATFRSDAEYQNMTEKRIEQQESQAHDDDADNNSHPPSSIKGNLLFFFFLADSVSNVSAKNNWVICCVGNDGVRVFLMDFPRPCRDKRRQQINKRS